MFNALKNILLILFSAGVMLACGDSDVPKEKMTAPATESTAVQLPVEVLETVVTEVQQEEPAEIDYLPNQVIYQDAIYKDWPYTEAPAVNAAVEMVEEVSHKVEEKISAVSDQAEEKLAEVKAVAEEKVAAVAETASDKPYQLVDGKISANAIEGWKTYNGGGCGACHGKGGIGAVGPNLGDSVTKKLSKDDFFKIVINGKSGTLMRPNKTNKRVMDNLENLYAYLVARGDDVLGPGNLIKLPLGK
jgi:mono/diheme cytochrome c family protein